MNNVFVKKYWMNITLLVKYSIHLVKTLNGISEEMLRD